MGPFLQNTVHLLLAVQAAQAQAQAALVGAVRDGATGGPLAGAVVALPDLNRATTTDAAGRYVLRAVPPGPQHLTVRFIGHTPRTLHALVPPDGRLEINVALRPEPMRLRTIEVRSPARVIVRGVDHGDEAAFPDRGSSIAAVGNHPLLAEPDALQALEGGEVVVQPESPSGVHVRGGAADQTAYLLDGIPVFSPYHAAGVFSAWNPDALAGVHLSSAAPSPAGPDALSGTIAAVTRTPGASLRAQGSVSTTQARVTLDGPLAAGGTGYLLSVRSDFPGAITPEDDASYLRGESGDWLAKLEAPAFGGRARVLAYGNDNELDAAAATEGTDEAGVYPRRNEFEWSSRSFGVEWGRAFSDVAVRVLAWSAAGDASAVWAAQAGWVDMTAARRDVGLLAAMEHASADAATVAGVRVERSTTSYGIGPDSTSALSWTLRARTPVVTAFAQHTRAIGHRLELILGTSLAAMGGDLYPSPRVQLRWKPSGRLTLSASTARLHQFAQSLRNPESVVGSVFPVDLYIGTGAPGVPVARSDLGVLAADYRPAAGVRLGAQAYARRFDGLLLVAPRDGEPFATRPFATGTGTARGVSLDAAMSAARYALLASYGLQRVRLTSGALSYVPDHGTTHLLSAGAIVFPTATTSIRLGATAAFGRRTTTAAGGLEWEACNLLDQGCEFSGSPHYDGEPLGATPLPSYVRVDLSARKHWHVRVGGRDAVVALFGTVTNLLGRKNVLTYVKPPSTGDPVPVEMRPLAPLVVGLDWRF